MNERELTYKERAVWGTCPICGAEPGKSCRVDVGMPILNDRGTVVREGEGVHLGRIQNAPRRIREVPIA